MSSDPVAYTMALFHMVLGVWCLVIMAAIGAVMLTRWLVNRGRPPK